MRSLTRPGLVPLLCVVLMATSCAELSAKLRDLPTLQDEDLRFRLAQSSKIYDADGNLIRTLHEAENRTVIPLSKTPKHLRQAVVAIEDARFFKHKGVDLRAIVRALLANVTSGEIREGGSTITQQYVKNVIIAPGRIAEKTYERKIIEAALARQLEQKLSKREILERYLNTVYFGEGAYGIEAAANTYFGKDARELNLPESALLAGVIRIPEDYDPFKNPKAAKARRGIVLDRMAELGYISEQKAKKAGEQKIVLDQVSIEDEYPAPYFLDYVQRLITYDPRFEMLGETVGQRTKRLFQGGLRIYTTIDMDMQVAAENAVQSVLGNPSDPYASMVAVEPKTGHVRALVGGRDWFVRPKEDPYAKVNLAIQAEPGLGRGGTAPGTGRQAGSAFKPFALAAAIKHGISLAKTYPAPSERTFPGANAGGDWNVQNYEGGSFGSQISVLEATVNSVNVVYAAMILDTGPQAVVDIAEDMGINTELAAVPSAALGSNSVNPLGMASAYATFATNGQHNPPVAITRIVDTSRGKPKTVYKDKTESEEGLDPGTSYLTTTALQDVIERGTGVAAQIGRAAAGKTGTAQEWRDAWFGGYTPNLAAAVWVGYPEGEIAMRSTCAGVSYSCKVTRTATGGSGVTGGSFPAMIWHAFMSQALAGVPASSFIQPNIGLITVTIDTRNGCLANESTPKEFRADAVFPKGSAPKKTCKTPGQKVPDVVGFPVEQAVDLLHRGGWEVEQREQETTEYPPGVVAAQSPAGGEKVKEGSTVVLYVSVGKGEADEEGCEVPEVLGMTEGQAKAQIKQQGLKAESVYEKESDDRRAKRNSGRVWKQSPSSGGTVDCGGTVYIWVNP